MSFSCIPFFYVAPPYSPFTCFSLFLFRGRYVCKSKCTPYKCSGHGGQKKVSGPLYPKLQVVVSL